MGFVVLRLVVETARDPTSHDLWPFEVLIYGMVSLALMAALAIAAGMHHADLPKPLIEQDTGRDQAQGAVGARCHSLALLLANAFLAALFWLLASWGWLPIDDVAAISWLALVSVAAILAVGMSWPRGRR